MSSYMGNGKCLENEPVEELLGVPARKAGEYNSTKVVVQEDMPMMLMPSMDNSPEKMPTKEPQVGNGRLGRVPKLEKIPVKPAGK